MAAILDRGNLLCSAFLALLDIGGGNKKQLSHNKKFQTLFLSSFLYRFFVVYSTESIEEDGRDDEEEYYEKQQR